MTLNGKVNREALSRLASKDPPPGEPSGVPRSLLEHRLVGIWERILGNRNISPEDNFFDLGGHSLLAASLLAEVERLVGRRVPLATLFHAPTAASMARAIEDQGAIPSWSSLVPLQPKGARPPFFFTHGWGGDVFGFVPIVRLLGPDQPVFGLQAVGLAGGQERHRTVEEMAAHYVGEIRALQSDGPYYVGGHSCGGIIAYEIAQQLCAQGQKVALLALLDSYVPRTEWFLPWPDVLGHQLRLFVTVNWPIHRQRLAALTLEQKARYVMRLSGKILRWFLWTIGLRSTAQSLRPQESKRPNDGLLDRDYYADATRGYCFKVYPGQVILFCAQDKHRLVRLNQIANWRYLAHGGLEVREVPGDHTAILHPTFMPDWAAQIKQCLMKAQTDNPPRP